MSFYEGTLENFDRRGNFSRAAGRQPAGDGASPAGQRIGSLQKIPARKGRETGDQRSAAAAGCAGKQQRERGGGCVCDVRFQTRKYSRRDEDGRAGQGIAWVATTGGARL